MPLYALVDRLNVYKLCSVARLCFPAEDTLAARNLFISTFAFD